MVVRTPLRGEKRRLVELAAENARLALASGTQDARLLIHAGLVELANGLSAEAQAHLRAGLELNPSFSPLVVEQARAAVTP